MEACESNVSKLPEVAMTKGQLLRSFGEKLQRVNFEMMCVGSEEDYRHVRHKFAELISNAKTRPELGETFEQISAVEECIKEAEIGGVTRIQLHFKVMDLIHEVTILVQRGAKQEFKDEIKNVLEEILTGSQKDKTLDEKVDFLINALF